MNDMTIAARIPKADYDMIQCLVKEGQYVNLSQFMRFAVKTILNTHLKISFTTEGVEFE